MSIIDKKSLEQLKKMDNIDFEKISSRVLDKIWRAIRNNSSELKDMCAELGEKKYISLVNSIKEYNSEYYDLNFLRSEDVDDIIKAEMLCKIYLNGVVVLNYDALDEATTRFINEKDAMSIRNVLLDITRYCIEYNYPGDDIIHILMSCYDIKEDVCIGLKEIYDRNRISLKLDYLIRNLQFTNRD